MNVLTLVAPERLDNDLINEFACTVKALVIRRLGANAVDLFSDVSIDELKVQVKIAQDQGLDAMAQHAFRREKDVLISDMDSTIIEQECLDELADVAGIGAEIAEITERAMRGELEFEGALRERVSRLEALPASTVDQVLKDRITLSPGAETLVKTMRARGAHTVLVSGGFTVFTGPVAERAGFELHFGNVLEVDDEGRLTGKVVEPILGRQAKSEQLVAASRRRGVSLEQAIAMGDGANDLAMIEQAGLGVAYKAKPIVAERARSTISNTDLTALLYFQGIAEADFIT